MNFIETSLKNCYVIEPNVFNDARGYFFESFNQKEFEEHIGKISFVQDNESKSSYGVLRGLHFQLPPFNQAKLIRCISGKVLDIIVDLRKGSETYGQHVAVELSGENKKQLFVPRGFAHGFAVLSESATFAYKVDNQYAPDHDCGIKWDDPALGIDWQIDAKDILLSDKDKVLGNLAEINNPFTI